MTENGVQYLGVEGLRVVLFGFQLTLVGLLGDVGLPLVGLGTVVSLIGLFIPQ